MAGHFDHLIDLFLNAENIPFFVYGSLCTDTTSYPVGAMTSLSCCSEISCSVKITACFFVWELETFLTEKCFRIVSLIWDSHMLQAIPSIPMVIFLIMIPSLVRNY